jgi:hypothetical protein
MSFSAQSFAPSHEQGMLGILLATNHFCDLLPRDRTKPRQLFGLKDIRKKALEPHVWTVLGRARQLVIGRHPSALS